MNTTQIVLNSDGELSIATIPYERDFGLPEFVSAFGQTFQRRKDTPIFEIVRTVPATVIK